MHICPYLGLISKFSKLEYSSYGHNLLFLLTFYLIRIFSAEIARFRRKKHGFDVSVCSLPSKMQENGAKCSLGLVLSNDEKINVTWGKMSYVRQAQNVVLLRKLVIIYVSQAQLGLRSGLRIIYHRETTDWASKDTSKSSDFKMRFYFGTEFESMSLCCCIQQDLDFLKKCGSRYCTFYIWASWCSLSFLRCSCWT